MTLVSCQGRYIFIIQVQERHQAKKKILYCSFVDLEKDFYRGGEIATHPHLNSKVCETLLMDIG